MPGCRTLCAPLQRVGLDDPLLLVFQSYRLTVLGVHASFLTVTMTAASSPHRTWPSSRGALVATKDLSSFAAKTLGSQALPCRRTSPARGVRQNLPRPAGSGKQSESEPEHRRCG